MGLEIVKEEVIRTAKNQETALIAEAKKEADRITKEAEKKIEQFKEQSNAETKKLMEVIKKQELASAELENKKMFLEAKKQVIDNVFAEVKKNLEKLDAEKAEAYIKKLLEKAKNDIEVATVYCNKKDLKFLKDLNPESTEIISGIIAENKDQTVRVDYSFDTIIQDIKENELQNINKILFG